MRSALLLLAPLAAWLAQRSGPTQQPVGINRVAWLAGCWESKSARRTVQESWMMPMGNTMIGTGRTVHGDSLVEYELVVLRADAATLQYEAHPSGQPAATFRATAVTERSVMFENRAHDFPQQIAYERRAADSLVAWIAGADNGTTRRIEFPYQRVACPR